MNVEAAVTILRGDVASQFDPDWTDLDRSFSMAWAKAIEVPATFLGVFNEGDEMVALGWVQRSAGGSSTLDRLLRVGTRTLIDPPLRRREVVAAVERRLQHHANEALSRQGRIPPQTWAEMMRVLVHLNQGIGWIFANPDRLRRTVPDWASREEDHGAGIVASEQAAVGLALKFAGSAMIPQQLAGLHPEGTIHHSILPSVIEDDLVAADLQCFGDLVAMPMAGRAQFSLADGATLIVVNTNRKPAEHALGVDLIYHNAEFDSFVLVQHKRMRRTLGGSPSFHLKSDRNLHKELERMRAISSIAREPALDATGLRLMHTPCFLKFCDPDLLLDQPQMAKGIYLPLDFFDELRAAGAFKGPRGGETVSYDTAGRRLTETEFVNLVQRGWAGSRPNVSSSISALVPELTDNGYWLVLAEYTPPPGGRRTWRRR